MSSAEAKNIRNWLIKKIKNAPPPSSLEEARNILEAGAVAAVLPDGIRVEPVTAGGVSCEWVSALSAEPGKVILHLHGGGYTKGSCRSARMLGANLSLASGCRTLLVDYRLAPEHPFPAALDDAVSSYGWLLEELGSSGNIAVSGDSAGAGLALALLLRLRDEGRPLPAAAIFLSPWTDLTCGGGSVTALAEADPWMTERECRSCAEMYIAGSDSRNPYISPLYGDLRGLPPFLVHVGSDEILLDDSLRLVEKAECSGVHATLEVWEGMWHVWHYFAPRLPEAREAIAGVGSYARRAFSLMGSPP